MIRMIPLMLGGLAACNATTTPREPQPVTEVPAPPDSEPMPAAGGSGPALPVAIVEPVEPVEPATAVSELDADPVEGTPSSGFAPTTVVYSLRAGETLDHFARWSGSTVEEIAESSALPLSGRHDVGSEIVILADDDLRATIDAARDAHHAGRVEHYLGLRGGLVDHASYTVRTGDTAWHVARRNGDLPVWILEELNPSLDLEALRPGQELTLPVTADMAAVADAEAASEAIE